MMSNPVLKSHQSSALFQNFLILFSNCNTCELEQQGRYCYMLSGTSIHVLILIHFASQTSLSQISQDGRTPFQMKVFVWLDVTSRHQWDSRLNAQEKQTSPGNSGGLRLAHIMSMEAICSFLALIHHQIQ